MSNNDNFHSSESFSNWEIGETLESYGCSKNGNFSIMTHGYRDLKRWVKPLVEMFLKHRGGCVIFLDYSKCTNDVNYLEALTGWESVSAVLTKKLQNLEGEGVTTKNILLYGFSLGARIVIDAAINFGKNKIGWVDGNALLQPIICKLLTPIT